VKEKLLIIGSSGQLASELRAIGSSFDFEYKFYAKEDINIKSKDDLRVKIGEFKPNFIINCAAYTAVDKAESEKEEAFAINEEAIKNIAEICTESDIHLVHISTDFVFDGRKMNPYQANDAVNPLSVYGESKLKGEEAITNSGCDYTIIRTSWLYSSFGANFVKTMIRLGKEKESLNVVNDQIGSPTYARDLAQFILENILEFPKFSRELYHFSNDGAISWYDFAAEIMKIYPLACTINPIPTSEYPTPAMRPKYSVMDKSKIVQHYKTELKQWEISLNECIRLLQN
jgi:dTDP-4-dehydrorhamnose reductase